MIEQGQLVCRLFGARATSLPCRVGYGVVEKRT
jgi:hypothetical protein